MRSSRTERAVAFALALGAVASCGFDGLGGAPPESVPDGGVSGADAAKADGGDGGGALDGSEGGICPAACNDGCAGGECRIKDPTASIACPPGMSCRVECGRQQVCRDVDCSAATRCVLACTAELACESLTLTCGAGPCTVSCTDEEACKNLSIVPRSTSELCLACASADSCASVSCVAQPSNARSCAGTCGGVGNCGALAAVTTCP